MSYWLVIVCIYYYTVVLYRAVFFTGVPKYLGEYVHGLSVEALRISVWKGDVVLKDLSLKAEALNSLKLPVTVKAGFIGTITLKVPWKSLGKEPVIVLIDRVFILAHPADGRTFKEEDREKHFEAKLQQIEPSPESSWLGSLIATIIGNLKISISNVHIRYEDSVSNSGHPFASGVTLAKLAAVTTDEQGNEIFDTSGAVDKLRKSLQLERLALYHDSNSLPWAIDKRWEDLSPREWTEIFEDGINEPAADCRIVSPWSVNRKYLLSPINGVLKYDRLGNQERNNPEIPFEKASLVLSDVFLTMTEEQYHDWIKLLEVVSKYRKYVEVSHLRPMVPVSEARKLWWRYAAQASLRQRKMCYRFSWDRIQHLCQLRRRYVQLYASSLQQSSNSGNSETREIEKDLDSKVIILWRLLAHAKVESVKLKEAAEQRQLKKKSWFPFTCYLYFRLTNSKDPSVGDASEESQLTEERLTNEEWQAINKLLSYQPGEESTSYSGKDMQNMIQYLVMVSIGQAAARIISINQIEILCGRFEQLHVSTKFKHRSIQCDVSLRFYGLSAPEGSLAEVLMESCDRFLEFIKRSNAVSPTIALETANALQMKIEKVTRRAQEQFQMVLEEQSRFALDIDLDAPKVRFPLRTSGTSRCDSHFLLDFGHFTLHTMGSQSEEQKQNIYTRFYIAGRDIAAFFTDCGSDSQNFSLVAPIDNHQEIDSTLEKVDDCYSLIDRCGMAVIVDQIKLPHPSYPSTRVSIQVPNLGVHFSPARYQRLMELVNIFYGTVETCGQPSVDNLRAELAPWNPADLAIDAKILVWGGIGNSVATWQSCFLVLSGLHLYVLESETSQNYQRSLSMVGRQVFEVLPTNIGGSPFCIAISFRGMDSQKAPPSDDVLAEEGDDATVFGELKTDVKTADLVVHGALVETKLFLYGKNEDKVGNKVEETLILELLAGGGKVHIISLDGDLTVKMKLHSLKIKDELQGCLSETPQYLACSVLKNDVLLNSQDACDAPEMDVSTVLPEEDDTFTDALTEFMSVTDASPGAGKDHDDFLPTEALIRKHDLVQEKGIASEIFYEAEGGDSSDFVSLIFSTRSYNSSDYDGIDMQLSIRMSKLEFFCNRPTLVALIRFGLDLSTVNYAISERDEIRSSDKSLVNKEKDEEHVRVEGLLGYGKDRVVFYLFMNVDSVSVFLNKEDGSQLAMFVQESFLLDLKVHPSSISIEGTLGNFRLCDMSLGTDHCWGWLCDIRNPGVESLIKFKFNSYSVGDDDYEGYDYSLSGRLSAVRIIFLYRFVQEITVYFMELAMPHTEEVINLVDKVGDFEWLIQKSEIDGSAALKLDLSLDTPIIIVPANSTSKDFIQLDLGHLRVTNEINWHGDPEKDPSAVHIDVLHAEIMGINMSVGIDGCLGKPMIREEQGLDVYVRHSLRDVFRKVPTFSLEVKVGYLHGVMSDKEYDVIINCTYINLNEEPKLPPSFRGSKSGSKDTMRLLADKVNMNSQMLLSQTVTIIAVEVNYALLELCNGILEESPLAHLALEGLWVSYRMTSLSEMDLYVTIPNFSVMDIRPNTKPEMRLMLGSSTDTFKQSSAGKGPLLSSFRRSNSEVELDKDVPISTMFLMDYRWRTSSQSYVVRIQQPRFLVVPDFVLAVGEFFVPALGAMTGRDETMDPKNDPISRNSSIVLSESVYTQTDDVVQLSPCRQLVADGVGVDEYIYNGCGKTICLSEEKHMNESMKYQPIIIIGRGKRLRFVNVKIENGSLLRKYVYLSSDSSYSVSLEDGVDIILPDTSSDDDKNLDNIYESSNTPNASSISPSDSSLIPSFTFEAQVVSPEFTFYDGTKSSLDDSSYGEKLLRAKMDLSFMYASKENDTWIRALVKALTVEAGSGLIILDPVDISGGYTSVKEKTNISLVATDICIHISLSAISLVLNLHSQVAAALQFGNAVPLAPCTNFDQVWVCPKENGADNNLTFWRPEAPSNYVILGDCVTSRSIPPSHAVMAVNNTYGRVRKPIGFNFIGFLSDALGIEGHSDVNFDCSLWMPVAPPGYIAMGCVAHVGNQPPPNHIVYCLRSDLVTSTTFSECIFSAPSSPGFASGFSIWRMDNVLGLFYAHPSAKCPSNGSSCDLNHLLLWNSIQSHFSSEQSASDLTDDHGCGAQQTTHEGASSSGWDVLRLEPPTLGIMFKVDNPEISARPVQFTKVAHIAGKGFDEAFFWYPIAPPGYVSLGCLVSKTDEAPRTDSVCCPRMDIVNQANILESPFSRSSTSKVSQCWSIWKVENQACTFLARSDLKKPTSRLAYTIGDSVKPKTQENINAEVKLRCLSLTILDSLCGMMTPLFDTTITNIKLATHGRAEAMNAVLISYIAASTFNTQLEAWEPLVEPFDGIFKFETYDTNVHPPSRLGKRVRVAATNVLNINVSAANLETFVDSVLSWRTQLELEQKAIKLNEEAGSPCGYGEDAALSALDEDDFKSIIVENKLGHDIFLKKVEQDSHRVAQLHHGDSASVWIPPPRFSDRLNVVDESRESRCYIAVKIIEAKGIPIIDDGNSHNCFCALRLVVDSQVTDQQKLFPQSARTKCVKPLVSKINDLIEGTAKWNEVFLFEVPRKGPAKLEVEVTNLAAKAGKGEVVGALSFPVGHGTNTLKKVSSSRMLHHPYDVQNIVSYSLGRKAQSNNDEDMHDYGRLFVSASHFERSAITNLQRDVESESDIDRDVGFWFGLHPEGVMDSVKSLLPISVVPKSLDNDFIAMEVLVKNGKKHAIFRGLVAVVNDSDVKLDVSLCPLSCIGDRNYTLGTSSRNTVTKQPATFIKDDLIVLSPGTSTVLPWRCTSKDTDQCLQVRPVIDHQPPYTWGCNVAIGSSLIYGKDTPLMDQVPIHRQTTLKQGSKMPANFTFRLSQLEKKDLLICCSNRTGSKQIWLSAGADASVLQTELNTPVYDWRISINSPLKLENRLPCRAEFTVWEKMREGSFIERQHGVFSSRSSAHIYSADVQRPLYLTLFIEGGWVLEKDPVLVLDLCSNDHISSFWMFNQQSKRRLRVSIERDMGGTSAAPKTIRFFVPYWIMNDSSLPLAYRVVEIEPLDSTEMDSNSLSRAVKTARTALKNPTLTMDRRHSGPRRNIRVLEVIEDNSPMPSMLSPQDSAGRSGVMLFTSQKDAYPSPRVGIAVAIRNSEIYSPGISLLELEKKERVDVTASSSDGSYYRLSAVLNMTSDRTKVVHFQPHTLFINRTGLSLCLQQCGSQLVEWIHPTDRPKPFRWQSSAIAELLKLRVDGCKWSTPFSVSDEGAMRVSLRKAAGVDGTSDSWQFLLPNSAASFLWEDLGRRHLLEILVDGADPSKSEKYNIDEVSDHQAIKVDGGPARALRVTVLKEERTNIVKISDWMPENEPAAVLSRRIPSPLPGSGSQQQQSLSLSDSEFHVIVELAELGISFIDHTPEEILYLSVRSLLLAYSMGLGSGFSRFKLRMNGIQVDNQLPLTLMPVLFRPQRVGEETEYILKFSVTLQTNESLDLCVYPYIGFHGPENSAFLINIHEPIIWRLHEMIQHVNISRLYDTRRTAVSVDPFIEIGVLNISEIRFKVSMAMSPSQRPRGVLGFWSSLMTALGNTENMSVRINQRFHENVCMRQSTMISNAISNIQKDLLGQPLQLLSGVDILGNASSALGHMSKGVAALSMDKKFIQSRQKQESKGVEDFGDVIREGGGALAKGLFRGVTGILTKPLEGAKSSGVEGFVQGVGKGIIGVAAQPVSGVLDLLSKTTEGANAMRMKIASAIASDEQLLRRRLPRVISGDNLLRPYDEYKAEGQDLLSGLKIANFEHLESWFNSDVILQLAESGSFFGQVDLFKIRGKFALSDAYEDHFILPEGKILMITHRRVILLQQPTNAIAQRKFSPARDPCSVLWDVLWDDLVLMELTHGKKDNPKALPSRLVLYLHIKSTEMKEQVRIIKCSRETHQALEVYSSIEQARNTYGQNLSKEMMKKKVMKPYSPLADGSSAEVNPKEGAYIWSPQHLSSFGSNTG
ncbi:C2 domain-containing protein [Citrus sinensis]|nr:C2 domain-containing protein [Citrus sinensis]